MKNTKQLKKCRRLHASMTTHDAKCVQFGRKIDWRDRRAFSLKWVDLLLLWGNPSGRTHGSPRRLRWPPARWDFERDEEHADQGRLEDGFHRGWMGDNLLKKPDNMRRWKGGNIFVVTTEFHADSLFDVLDKSAGALPSPELPHMLIIENIVEIPEFLSGAPKLPRVSVSPAELVEVVELGPPFPAESAPPLFVMALVVNAPSVVVKYVQPPPVVEYVAPAPVAYAAPAPVPKHPAPAITYAANAIVATQPVATCPIFSSTTLPTTYWALPTCGQYLAVEFCDVDWRRCV